MPSKGITVYSYVSVDGYEVEFTVPGEEPVINTSADNFTAKHLEMESSRIHGLGTFTGRFQWTVRRWNRRRSDSGEGEGDEIEVVGRGHNNINSLTGNLEGGTMISTVHFTPIVTDEVIITYGFYDAGSGEAGLTNRDQCYVTVCPVANRSWMGDVAPPGSWEAEQPFSRFVLAAPHDNGMNSMESADAVLQGVDHSMIGELKQYLPKLHFFSHLPDKVMAGLLPNIVYGVAITQKKDMAVMLALGARYFEFRPAELLPLFQRVSLLPNKFYFHHSCIPGLAFDEFLDSLVAFLDDHPTEMITIHIRHDNIVQECLRPTPDEVGDMLTSACERGARNDGPLTWGGSECFRRPISHLRSTGQRLICLIDAEKYDSWTADAYATLIADPILARFESMTTAGQETTVLTVLQCQATSQSIKEVLVYSVLSANAATSCLTSTKGALDMHTLPWIREHALDRLRADRTIVIMNDFIDGATTDTAIELSRRRLRERI